MTLLSTRRSNIKFTSVIRTAHSWTGLVLSLFILIISLTGFALIHEKNWRWLDRLAAPQFLIPSWAREESARKSTHVKGLVLQTDQFSERSVVGTPAGLFTHTSDGWKPIESSLGPLDVTALLLSHNRWWLGTKHGLLESRDQGHTWNPVWLGPQESSISTKINVIRTSPFDSHTLYVGTKHGVYRSPDDGNHWNRIANAISHSDVARLDLEQLGRAQDVSVIEFDQQHPDWVFLGTHHGLYLWDQQQDQLLEIEMTSIMASAKQQMPRMTIAKYLNDLHTGKLFADRLWTLYDLTAISLVLFVATGLYIWGQPRLSKWRENRSRKGTDLNPVAGSAAAAGRGGA